MTMMLKGLAKLVEECGELVQVAAKKMACPDTDQHWDGGEPLSVRIADEMGDVLAACTLVTEKLGLDQSRIEARHAVKLARFRTWDNERET